MTKLTSAFTHTCHHLTKLLSQVLQQGKHAPLPFTGLFRPDPWHFIGTQTAATVAVLTGSVELSELPYDSQPPTITCQSQSTSARKVGVETQLNANNWKHMLSFFFFFFLPLQLFGNEPQYFAECNTQSSTLPGREWKTPPQQYRWISLIMIGAG